MPKIKKDRHSPEDRAQLDAMTASRELARQAAADGILETGWAKLEQAHSQLKSAGRVMILFGVRALQLKAVLPYGEFNRQLALHCPQISRRNAYRGMQVTIHLLSEIFQLCHARTTGEVLEEYLAGMADALTGTGDAALLETIDDLIEGKSGRQLVLEARTPKKDGSAEDEEKAKAKCLVFFESDPRGSEKEDALRWQAEAGEMSWGEVWRDCTAINTKRNDLITPLDPVRGRKMLSSGLFRLNSWATPAGWEAIKEDDRELLLESWSTLLDNLNPDFRIAAITKLKGGKP